LPLDPRKKMSRRFFVDFPIQGDVAILTGQEARHLSKVMRAKVGDEFVLFDGSGVEFLGRIDKLAKSEIEFVILDKHEVDRELSVRLVVGVALPKGDRQRWLVEKLVELGVAELVPLISARSVAQPSNNALERLRRAVIEASKQCGRNRLMAVGEACTFESFTAGWLDVESRLIAHPSKNCDSDSSWLTNAKSIVVAVGPEGGFTDEEIALAGQRNWQGIALGPRVLRTETAAVAVASAIALGVSGLKGKVAAGRRASETL
jgi:16S rRNA (uracil1498-N3)-methyltransferase